MEVTIECECLHFWGVYNVYASLETGGKKRIQDTETVT